MTILEVNGEQIDVQPPFIHLNNCLLPRVPPELLCNAIKNLVRLDLGWNDIRSLPREISVLSNLEQLWLNCNPLQFIPAEIEGCRSLQVLDLHDTELVSLPREMGRLQKLVTVDLRGIPTLEVKIQEAYEMDATEGLLAYLRNKDIKKELEIELEARFKEGIYREVSDEPSGAEKIHNLTTAIFEEFTDHALIKNLIRNCERLFPADIDKADVKRVSQKFFALRKENDMKKMAAELELKLRIIYFDIIKPSSVEGIVRSIYTEIKTLDDIKFLIRYAKDLFPEDPEKIVASEVKGRLVALQQKMAEERAAAISMVEKALRSLYPHVDPKNVKALTDAVCVYFRKVEDLKKLAADSSIYFMAEFEAAMQSPKAIRGAFKKASEE